MTNEERKEAIKNAMDLCTRIEDWLALEKELIRLTVDTQEKKHE